MHSRAPSGFILPLALVLSSGLFLLAMLAWSWETGSLPRHEATVLHERARTTLLLNLAACLEHLKRDVLEGRSASALVPVSGDEPVTFRPVGVNPESGEHTPLHSTDPTGMNGSVLFHSPLSGTALRAGRLPLEIRDSPITHTIAWAAEDIELMAPDSPPPESWPLPEWDLVPMREAIPIEDFLNGATQGAWQSLEWFPADQPLPMQETSSPALVPVVRQLGVRFGIFAAGRARNHEKTIRVRFFIEGELWNPYNRPLVIHPGSGMRSVLRAIFWNLPEIRIHNRTLGISSPWLPLDNARNSRSGSTGLHGYIRLPGELDSGESLAFVEPDPNRQPQGLARTLHPGVRVRPADRIEIEIRQPPGGLYAACLPMEASDPLGRALDGDGWFRVEAFPVDWPNLTFPRADAGPRPFLLEQGSLSFRIDNAHLKAVFTNRVANYPYSMDPRQKRVVFNESQQAPDGTWITGVRLLSLQAMRLNSPFTRISPQRNLSLFSWPADPPTSLVGAMDLPQWKNGYRLGSAGADALNRHLGNPALPVFPTAHRVPVRLPQVDGPPLDYRHAFPLNQLSEAAWMRRLVHNGRPTGAGELRFPLYVYPDATSTGDFRTWRMRDLETAVKEWTASIALVPFKSSAEFFSSGILPTKIPEISATDPLHPFMPLRGWLRDTPPPRAHGAAWILHLASEAVSGAQRSRVSARVWLLESLGADAIPQFDIIRFEWTDPDQLQQVNPH